MRNIVVVPYDKQWPIEFEKIKSELMHVIKDDIISIEHVGSTSVEGLCAKPVIDIDIIIEKEMLPVIVEKLMQIGYNHEGDLGVVGREAFKYENKAHLMHHHLYVCPKDSAELRRHTAFRDYLREHPMDRDKYGNIKVEMAKKFPHDIDNYIKGKEPVVMEIYRKCGVPIKTAVIKVATCEDFDFVDKNDVHLCKSLINQKIESNEILLIKQDDITIGWLRYGYFWDHIPFMNMLYILAPYRNQGHGKKLVLFWENDMMKNGFKNIMTSSLSNETAQHFYRKLGYKDVGCLIIEEALEIIFLKDF